MSSVFSDELELNVGFIVGIPLPVQSMFLQAAVLTSIVTVLLALVNPL